MGLDMVPMGKPKPGHEIEFSNIFNILSGKVPHPPLSLWDKLRGRQPDKEALKARWFEIQTPAYETIAAPCVGRDAAADAWARERYQESDKKITEAEFLQQLEGYYVIELAPETPGVPVYMSFSADRNAFRGQFLEDCEDVIGKDLVSEAWETKMAAETLAYGRQLMAAADLVAGPADLLYLKHTRSLGDAFDEKTLESRLHIVYSLANWLIFYGERGHGYEADY